MRYLLASFVLLTLLVLSPVSDAQEKPGVENRASSLVGTWVSRSKVGDTVVRYRKDGWFISAFYFTRQYSLTRDSVWTVGHWALSDDMIILHRLAGSDGLELVPEKRKLALKELTGNKLLIGNVPLDGQAFERMEEIPSSIEKQFSGSVLARQVYEQEEIILPEDAKKDVESYVGIEKVSGRTIRFYLSPGGEFLGSIGNENDDLIGKWEKSGDFLIISGVTEKQKLAILLELRKIEGQYKLFNVEQNGEQRPAGLNTSPFQKIEPVLLSIDGAEKYLQVQAFNDWYAKLSSISEGSAVRKQVANDGMIEEAKTSSKLVFKGDIKTGQVIGITKVFEEDGYYMTEVDGQYDAFLGASLSKFRSTKFPKSFRYQIGVISKLEPRTFRWFFTSGAIPKTDEYFSQQVETQAGLVSKIAVKRDGKIFLEINGVGTRTADFDKKVWDEFKASAEALFEIKKDKLPAEPE
tara:strand:+ start:3905 stop:5299 length:1395 start_codon:yes stop_codon:yes gene_type:complete